MKVHETEPRHGESAESQAGETPAWVVVAAAILISIPLGLCCYLLLRL